MKELLILRHGKARIDAPGGTDFDRKLAPRGRRAASRVADYLMRRGAKPDLVLVSPALRTRETWELMAPGFPAGIKVRLEARLYLASREALRARLARLADDFDRVLLIGHNPGLHELALQLSAGGRSLMRARMVEKFPTAALARFAVEARHWADLGPDTARLVDYVTPADLET